MMGAGQKVCAVESGGMGVRPTVLWCRCGLLPAAAGCYVQPPGMRVFWLGGAAIAVASGIVTAAVKMATWRTTKNFSSKEVAVVPPLFFFFFFYKPT